MTVDVLRRTQKRKKYDKSCRENEKNLLKIYIFCILCLIFASKSCNMYFMRKFVLASNNVGKIAEFREMLGGQVLTPKELGISFDVEETGATFFDNALIKARARYELCGMPTLADDSGLCVDALLGAPGVFSARYSGNGEKANNAKLLEELNGKPSRSAHFTCCIVYYDGKNVIEATGNTSGSIALAERGTNGFGYDPLFISDDLGMTFGEATEAQKNNVSHRARALIELKKKLDEFIGQE